MAYLDLYTIPVIDISPASQTADCRSSLGRSTIYFGTPPTRKPCVITRERSRDVMDSPKGSREPLLNMILCDKCRHISAAETSGPVSKARAKPPTRLVRPRPGAESLYGLP